MAKNKHLVTIASVSVIAVALVALFAMGVFGNFNVTDRNDQGKGDAGCNVVPSISPVVLDGLDQGTSVSTTNYYRVNGAIKGAQNDSFEVPKGATVEILASASNYLDQASETFKAECGPNFPEIKLYATDSMTLELKDDSTTLTDSASGGTSNMSTLAAGGSDTVRVLITGKDKESSGDLIYVVELGSTANVSDVTMSDNNGVALEKVDVPSFYSQSITGSKVVAFKIPAIIGAVEKEYKMTYTAKSGKNISGAVYTTMYSVQDFVDDDGTFKPGIEDQSGDTKYEDTYDYDFYIA